MRIVMEREDNIVVRDFKPEDSIFLEEIFKLNLERYLSYLTPDQKKLFLEVNTAKRFVELSQRPNDISKVVEKDGKIVGYFHFGKNKEKEHSLKMKRGHLSTPQQGIFKNYVRPLIHKYAKEWGCNEIVYYIMPHIKPIYMKLNPNAIFYGPEVKHRRGVNMVFYKCVEEVK
jgi:hypothetical protein